MSHVVPLGHGAPTGVYEAPLESHCSNCAPTHASDDGVHAVQRPAVASHVAAVGHVATSIQPLPSDEQRCSWFPDAPLHA